MNQGSAKPKPVRVNVRARAQLFERPTNDDSAAEKRRKHAEAALKAKTVQQVLKQVESSDGGSRRGSESDESKSKRAQTAREAKTVQQVLKSVVNALSNDDSEDKSKEKSENVEEKEKKGAVNALSTNGDSEEKFVKVEEKEKKSVANALSSDDSEKKATEISVKVEEKEKKCATKALSSEKSKEKSEKVAANVLPSDNIEEKSKKKSEKVKKKEDVKEETQKKVKEERKEIEMDARREKKSPETEMPPTTEEVAAKISSEQSRTSQPTAEREPEELKDESVETSHVSSLTEPEIDGLLREECKSGPEEQPTTVCEQNDATKTVAVANKQSTFWRALSDSGSSSSSSCSEPECQRVSPARGRCRSALLSQLGLAVSRSSTSSPEFNWSEGKRELEIDDEERKGRSKLEGGGDVVANSKFSNSASSGLDKWRLDSGDGDYELRVKDENPSLLELLNSVRRIQEEFGRVVLDEGDAPPSRIRAPLLKSVSFPEYPAEREDCDRSSFGVNKDGARRRSCVRATQPEVGDGKTGVLTTGDDMERKARPFAPSSSPSTLKPVQIASSRKYEPPFLSKPLSPPCKVQVTPKPEIPSYLTVGRRGFASARKETNNKYSDSERADFEKIETILNELDFSKFRRGRSNTLSPRTPRSLSESPRPATRIPVSPVVNKCVQQQPTRLQVPPHTYRHYSSPATDKVQSPSPTRHKLKELTERLKPVIATTVRPPNKQQQHSLLQQQWHNQQLQQQLLQQHKQLQQLQQQHLEQLQRLQQQTAAYTDDGNNKGQYYVSGSLTLPHRHRTMESDKNTNPKIEIVSDEPNVTPPHDSVHDEGLGSESALPSTYAQAYHNVTSSPGDKRGKRRKNANNVGFHLSSYENNGRSLTYPPQRKGSLSEEMEFTSVDSNGMRSFGGGDPDEEPRRQLSDVSLADSHYSPSEYNVGETFVDVVERVTQEPNEVDERGGKCAKKKHYSDPSGDKNEPLLDLPEFIAAAKSDPQLINTKSRRFRVEDDAPTTPPSTLRTSQSAPVPLVSSDAENSDRERFPTGKSPHQQRRYFKKRLRGPYGEMLEEEMRKSGEKQMQSKLSMAHELSFLKDIMDEKPSVNSSRAAQSDSCDDSWQDTSSDKGVKGEVQDTRTHVVGELYDTERSYVESLQILVTKYYQPLKSSENSGLVDSGLVDDMFFQVPEILVHHESFLDLLRHRLENWDGKQKVGDVFVEAFTKQQVINTYTAFINNWKTAKEAIKISTQAKPAFAKFLEHTSREHKGKLTLDALLIMPVQRIPRYELLIKELLKHTQVDHPDHRLLEMAQKEVHELAVKINRMEKEAYAAEQMLQKLKEIENVIDGLVDLVQPDRSFLRYDLVTMSGGLGTKKERCLFLFTDLLIITSIKRKSGTAMRKASAALNSPAATNYPLEMNKYKMLMKLSLEDLDTSKNNDVNIKKTLKEIDQLEEDCTLLGQISELTNSLNCSHQNLDEIVRELLVGVSKQLQEKHGADSHLLSLELTVTTQEGIENLTLVFSAPEKRATWETAFTEAKQKLSLTNGHRPPPEFISPVPIRKTRAGLQFTCATPTLGLNCHNLRDVWVCNSDGYVGQVCVLSLQPDPTVTSCNGVTNARILCIASVPAASATPESHSRSSIDDGETNCQNNKENDDQEKNKSNDIQLDSSESSEEEDEGIETQADDLKKKEDSLPLEESHEVDDQQPTMWLGTEDGCVHIYNCNDNIRTKKNKVKLQHSAPVHSILHTDNKVFVSLANGDLTIYRRETSGCWRTNDPKTITVGNAVAPVSRMISVAGKLWCACQNTIKVINTCSLEIEQTFAVTSDTNRFINCMATSGFGVWISIQNSATIKLFHAISFECLVDLSVAASVTKMLAGCDDIIRQHKSACLRITALLSCKDLMWVGTSAGVILTIVLPHLTSNSTKLGTLPTIAGIPHGHSGHVRFLTYVEMLPNSDNLARSRYSHRSLKGRDGVAFSRRSSLSATMANKMLVISGGDGYEDFRNTDLGETAGRDDSTNHLLLWQV